MSDTVIKSINLRNRTEQESLYEIEKWINDTATKLNMLLNAGRSETEEETVKVVRSKVKYVDDYVVDQGETLEGICAGSIPENSKCYFRKLKSGILEIWGYRMSNNVYIDRPSWGNGYESYVYDGESEYARVCVWGEWPVEFVEEPSVSFRLSTTSAQTHAGDYQIIYSEYGQDDSRLINTKTTSPSFKLWRGTALNHPLYNPIITFHAIGSWK